jgi:hypothetical protein
LKTISTTVPSQISSSLSEDLKDKLNKNQFNKITNTELALLNSTLESTNLLNTSNLKELIKLRIRKEKALLISKDSVINLYKNEIDSLSLTIQKKIFSYSVLNMTNPYDTSISGNISINAILIKAETLRRAIKNLEKETSKQQREYSEYISSEDIKIVLNKDLKEANEVLIEAFIKVNSDLNKMYETISAEKVIAWLNILINKENNSGFSYTSLPMQLNGDQTSLSIKLIPQKEEYGLPSYATEINFPQKKAFFVGAGTSFYGAWFKDDVYSTKATIIDNTKTDYKIINEENKAGELGVIALIHFGYRPFYNKRNGDWFAVNLVTGPALSLTQKIKPRIAIGGGLAFGKKNMLSINLLYMGGYVEKKSNVFDTSETYSSSPENVTVSKMSGSTGVSFGYIYKF